MKRFTVTLSLLLISCAILAQAKKSTHLQPNIIVILADDLGYGDLGCYGHPTIETPFLDQMAHEGMRFTQFYVGGNVCTPSRAALMTGRLPVRYGMAGAKKLDVLAPRSALGLPQSEITIARLLQTGGYKTGIIGKWHLGAQSQFLPNNHGFDYYFGLPYSNNSKPLPLYKNQQVIEQTPDQSQLTERYTTDAIQFIRENQKQPFFLYYASHAPHIPLHASKKFSGKSKRGVYGDVVLELDWSVGQILKTLRELQLEQKTLVIFTSDNGPWYLDELKEKGGSAGLLFEGKQSTYEGGMRVPAIFWWPGTIRPNMTQTAVAATMDLLPTFANLAGLPLPSDRKYDGYDLMPLLKRETEKVREFVYYYNRSELYAIRKGPFKAHFTTKTSYSNQMPVRYERPLLYQIEHDPSEKYNVNETYPDKVDELIKEFERFNSSIEKVPPIFDSLIVQ